MLSPSFSFSLLPLSVFADTDSYQKGPSCRERRTGKDQTPEREREREREREGLFGVEANQMIAPIVPKLSLLSLSLAD